MDYKKDIIKVVGISVAVIAVLTAAIFWTRADIEKKGNEITVLKQSVSNKTISVDFLANLLAQENQAKEYSAQMDAMSISKDQLFLNFPNDLNLMAQQNGLTAQVLFKGEVEPTENSARKTEIAITLTGKKAQSGSFDNFLTMLEHSKYSVKLDNIDFSQTNDGISANLSGSVFTF